MPLSRESHEARRAERKTKQAASEAAHVSLRDQRQARINAYVAAHGDKIAAQRAACYANHASHLQKLAVTRAGVLRVAPTATAFDVFKLRNRAFSNTVQAKIAALKRAAP